jgi:hypothetical protein
MSRKSKPDFVRKTVGELPSASPSDLRRLRRAMKSHRGRALDEGLPQPGQWLRPRPSGRTASKPPSMLREAILSELGRRQMTRYQLFKAARKHCATISESAVYEFLRGQRQVSAEYVDAMLLAAGLSITPARPARKSA